MSLRPVIPQRGARQQSPLPLHRLDAILKSGGEVCQSRMKLKKNPLDTASRFQRWLPRSRAGATREFDISQGLALGFMYLTLLQLC
jgi:hypothetical protein